MRKPPARRDAQRSSLVSIRSATGLAPSVCQARRSAFRKRTPRLWLEYSSRSATPPASSARTISATPGGIFPHNGGLLERLCVTGGSRDCRFAAVYAPFDLKRPFLGVLSAKECLIDILSFPPHLGSPGSGIELGECRQTCALCVHWAIELPRKGAAQWRRPTYRIENTKKCFQLNVLYSALRR